MNDFLIKVMAIREEEQRLARIQKAKNKKAERKAQRDEAYRILASGKNLTREMERIEAIKSLRARGFGWVLDKP